jgi:hypothetical protein
MRNIQGRSDLQQQNLNMKQIPQPTSEFILRKDKMLGKIDDVSTQLVKENNEECQ